MMTSPVLTIFVHGIGLAQRQRRAFVDLRTQSQQWSFSGRFR